MFLEVTFPTLAPIFLMVLLGWAMHRSGRLPEGFFSGLNTLTFYIGLPSLLLVGIATAPIDAGPALRIFYVLLAATTVITILAYFCARWLRLRPATTASFVQASMRGNLAYIGLPVIFYALDSMPADTTALRASAMLVLAPSVPLYNIACVIILAHGASRGSGDRPSALKVFGKVLRNPLLLACIVGLALSGTGIGLPLTLERTLRPLGQMALPLALFSIGASFTQSNLLARLGFASWVSAFLKVALLPGLGYICIQLFGLSDMEGLIAMILLACPTAVSGYVMAEQMGADADLAGSAILVSTLLAMPILAIVLSIA